MSEGILIFIPLYSKLIFFPLKVCIVSNFLRYFKIVPAICQKEVFHYLVGSLTLKTCLTSIHNFSSILYFRIFSFYFSLALPFKLVFSYVFFENYILFLFSHNCFLFFNPSFSLWIFHYFAIKGLSSQSDGFSSSYVLMWELDYKESWALKNWCFWTVVLEKTLESPLYLKEIQLVYPKGNHFRIFIGKTDTKAETPLLWPPDAKT